MCQVRYQGAVEKISPVPPVHCSVIDFTSCRTIHARGNLNRLVQLGGA